MDAEALSPFVANSLYMVIIAERQLCRETHDDRIWNALSSLETMLRHFSKRCSSAGMPSTGIILWRRAYKFAGKYLRLLN